MSATMIRPVENNPLKFARTPEDALQSLFGAQNPGYLPPAEAFRDAFEDIALHQVAVLAGVRAAYDSMLAAFRPDRLEAQYERRLQRASFIRLYGPLRYWALYRAQFEEIDADPEAHFQRLFGEEFAKAYTDQLQSLQTAARSSNRQVRT
jgi:type VI secretion system FHA domain protein